jgi:hypothetical protein
VFGDLKTWGWISLLLGILELLAAFSLMRGGAFGRWLAIFAASLVALDALFEIPAYPFWSLAVFALSLWIIHGLAIFREPEEPAAYGGSASGAPREAVGPRPPA